MNKQIGYYLAKFIGKVKRICMGFRKYFTDGMDKSNRTRNKVC